MPEEVVRETLSVCPECSRVIPAKIVNRDGKLYIVKDCPEHGHFEELYWADYDLYKEYMKYFQSGPGINNPMTEVKKGLPMGLWSLSIAPILFGLDKH